MTEILTAALLAGAMNPPGAAGAVSARHRKMVLLITQYGVREACIRSRARLPAQVPQPGPVVHVTRHRSCLRPQPAAPRRAGFAALPPLAAAGLLAGCLQRSGSRGGGAVSAEEQDVLWVEVLGGMRAWP